MHIKPAIALFLACILAIPAMWPSPTVPRYIQALEQSDGKNYAFNCLLIDIAQVVRGLGLLFFYRTTHRKQNLDQAIAIIQNQLKEFEPWLLQEEQNALIEIKNKFNMSDEIWNTYLVDVKELKNIYTKCMHQEHPNVVHDTNIPSSIFNTITTLLTNNNINPHSISIKMINFHNKSTVMQVHVPLATTINHNNQFIVDKAYIPPVIEISAYATQVSHEKLIALCAHEIQHLIQHHTITDIIKEYIEHYSSINSNTLDACPEYQKLGQLHEAQAEVFSAIKNPEIAHCLKEYRRCTFYPDNLYEKHYYNISTIDMLWKLDDWLTKWQQFSIINTTYDMLAKMRTIAGAFKELITA